MSDKCPPLPPGFARHVLQVLVSLKSPFAVVYPQEHIPKHDALIILAQEYLAACTKLLGSDSTDNATSWAYQIAPLLPAMLTGSEACKRIPEVLLQDILGPQFRHASCCDPHDMAAKPAEEEKCNCEFCKVLAGVLPDGSELPTGHSPGFGGGKSTPDAKKLQAMLAMLGIKGTVLEVASCDVVPQAPSHAGTPSLEEFLKKVKNEAAERN